MNKSYVIEILYEKATTQAYERFLALEEECAQTDELYGYFDIYMKALRDKNSFVRVRAFRMISKVARWDIHNEINNDICEILSALDDEKPIAVRQCLAALPDLAEYKPELKPDIRKKLMGLDYLKYKVTMQGLIKRDIDNALGILNACPEN